MNEDLVIKFDKIERKDFYLDLRKYECLECGFALEPYSFGLGKECRCKNCGYKDPCCE
jgi:hypothetical protein